MGMRWRMRRRRRKNNRNEEEEQGKTIEMRRRRRKENNRNVVASNWIYLMRFHRKLMRYHSILFMRSRQ